MSTFERLELSEYDDGPCPWPADVYRTALKAAYAELDRLRANALEWVTVTEDLATLPDQDSERDVLVDTVRWDDGEPSEMRTYYVLHLETCSVDNLTPGDRWAYIPEAKE